MFRPFILALIAAGACGPAMAAGALTSKIELHGTVPVICHATLRSAAAPNRGSTVQLGALDEFCNSAGGYAVVVAYAPEEGLGDLVVDGHVVPLDPCGRTVISRAYGPTLATRSVAYRPGRHAVSSLSIRIETSAI